MYDHQERLEREFAPTMTHLREVEGQIAFHQEEIDKLKEVHRRLVAIERIIHPPEPKPKKVKPSANGYHAVSEETLGATIDWLRHTYPDGDISTSVVLAHPEWSISKSHTQKILVLLHERGQLRLDSTGQGGRRNYRVVA